MTGKLSGRRKSEYGMLPGHGGFFEQRGVAGALGRAVEAEPVARAGVLSEGVDGVRAGDGGSSAEGDSGAGNGLEVASQVEVTHTKAIEQLLKMILKPLSGTRVLVETF